MGLDGECREDETIMLEELKMLDNIKRLAAFGVLMENGQGIVGKSPSYILEKFELCMGVSVHDLPGLLDNNNQEKYSNWCSTWGGDNERKTE